METTPTEHGAIIKFNFPKFTKDDLTNGWNQTRRVWVGGPFLFSLVE
eukprot:SAG31_NODE_2800_length_5077_cov_2.098433_11_plen_47_part_00